MFSHSMADSSWYALYIFLQMNDRDIMISAYASVSHLFQSIKSTETCLNVTTHVFIAYFCYIQDEEWRVKSEYEHRISDGTGLDSTRR
jgi:hypothetical protein